jgi:hypothetical protein
MTKQYICPRVQTERRRQLSIIRKFEINEGLVKYRQVLVEQFHQRVNNIHQIDTTLPGQSICILWTTFGFEPRSCPSLIQCGQCPWRVAYTSTCNRCEGLTLEKVILDFQINVFLRCQLYCPVSRVRHRNTCN